MKKEDKGQRSTKSKASANPFSKDVDDPQPPLETLAHQNADEIHRTMRETLSKQLHDLMNYLWPAAARIEVATSDKSCSGQFRETLEQIGRCIEEAMTIATQASELVDTPPNERTAS